MTGDAMNNPQKMLRPGRKITGISAILLPFTEQQEIAWDELRAHIRRTAEAGIIPAVNMDTGYVNLLSSSERRAVLRATQETLGNGTFVAGAFVSDQPGNPWNKDAYFEQIDAIQQAGGIPVIFQSYGLTQQDPEKKIGRAHV